MVLDPDTAPQDRRLRDMVRLPGGTFRMGSDDHYPEEAPSHRVTVDGFWIDRTPVTNAAFKRFVKATGHVTMAEKKPRAADYPDALPEMLYAGSLVFDPRPDVIDLRDWGQWWNFRAGADWRHPYGKGSNIHGLDDHPVVHVLLPMPWPMRVGRARTCRPRRNGNMLRAAAWTAPNLPGATNWPQTVCPGQTPGRAPFRTRTLPWTAMSAPRP